MDTTTLMLFVPGPDNPRRAAGDRRGLARLRRGVYAEAQDWEHLAPWERYRHRVLAHAAVSPRAVFSHESAAVLLGLPVFGEPRDIHVMSERARNKRVGDVLLHGSEAHRELCAVDGVLVTDPAHTAVDLGRILAPAQGLAVWDAVLRAGGYVSDLTRIWHRQPSSRNTRTLQWLEQFADPRAESPTESVSRAVISWLGFPTPELQHEFRVEGAADRGDFWWESAQILGESDGLSKYGTEDPLSVLRAEKTREDRLRRHVLGLARWTSAEAYQPEVLRARLRAAGLRETNTTDLPMLTTLSHPKYRRDLPPRNTQNRLETPS